MLTRNTQDWEHLQFHGLCLKPVGQQYTVVLKLNSRNDMMRKCILAEGITSNHLFKILTRFKIKTLKYINKTNCS